jgi:hypothetical protein
MSHIQATMEKGSESSSCDKIPAEGLGKASRRLFIMPILWHGFRHFSLYANLLKIFFQ